MKAIRKKNQKMKQKKTKSEEVGQSKQKTLSKIQFDRMVTQFLTVANSVGYNLSFANVKPDYSKYTIFAKQENVEKIVIKSTQVDLKWKKDKATMRVVLLLNYNSRGLLLRKKEIEISYMHFDKWLQEWVRFTKEILNDYEGVKIKTNFN